MSIRESNPRLVSAITEDARKAIANQAKERIGGKILAAFGSDHRQSTPYV